MGILDAPSNQSASGAMRNLMSKLTRGVSDAAWLTIGDSTGNDTTEWVYLTTLWLAAKFPAYTVKYYLWDISGDTDYATVVTVQTGTGTALVNGGAPFTLTVWNASVAGSSTGYFQGTRFANAIQGKSADLVMISHGHNHGGPIDTDNLIQYQRNRYMTFVDEVAQANPNAGVVCVMQNPKIDHSSGAPTHPFEWQPQKALLYAQAALWRGWGVVDVLQAFIDYGTWQADLMNADGVHPNSAGQAIWAAKVQAALGRATKVSAVAQPTASAPGRQLITNPELSSWSGTNPDGVAMSTSPACTASKELTDYETGTAAMLLTASSTSGQPYAEWTATAAAWGINGLLANKTYTAMVRIKVAAANTSTVRITLQDNNGSAQSCTADVDAATRDRYCWVYVTKTFASNATSLSLRVSPRSTGTAVVTCLVDRIYLIPGGTPSPYGGTSPINQIGPSSVTFGANEVQTAAEANMNRLSVNGGTFVSNTSQVALFAEFIAKQTITINNLTVFTGSTARAATPTTIKYAVYSVDAGTGDITRLGITANDTSLLAATFTGYTKALGGAVVLTQGLKYAYAVLQDSSVAVATLQGCPAVGLQNEFFRAPRLSYIVTGQTDLLSSYSNASLGSKNAVPYIVGT